MSANSTPPTPPTPPECSGPPPVPPNTPAAADVMRAVETYLKIAYGAGGGAGAGAGGGAAAQEEVPVTVRSQLAVLRNWKGDFYHSPAIAADHNDPPRRYTLRLGNRNYPHMKLAIELAPDGKQFLFRVDTHDGHCLPPPTAAEYGPFLLLMEENQKMAQAIESAWAGEKLPTFKTYLRDDLARRHEAEGGKTQGTAGTQQAKETSKEA